MSYIDPRSVAAPKAQVSNVEVIYDSGPEVAEGWSVATLTWTGRPVVGIRWNGDPKSKGIGTPQARGIPTWFVLPDEVGDAVLAVAKQLASGEDLRLLSDYDAMAADVEREREAEEWIEGMIGDVNNSTR